MPSPGDGFSPSVPRHPPAPSPRRSHASRSAAAPARSPPARRATCSEASWLASLSHTSVIQIASASSVSLGDDVAQAAGHGPGAFEQDRDQRVALAGTAFILADQAIEIGLTRRRRDARGRDHRSQQECTPFHARTISRRPFPASRRQDDDDFTPLLVPTS